MDKLHVYFHLYYSLDGQLKYNGLNSLELTIFAISDKGLWDESHSSFSLLVWIKQHYFVLSVNAWAKHWSLVVFALHGSSDSLSDEFSKKENNDCLGNISYVFK